MKSIKTLQTLALAALSATLVGCGTTCLDSPVKNEPAKQVAVNKAQSDTFHFAFDKSSLSTEDKAQLKKYVETLKENPEMKVSIEGYTDKQGREGYNNALGMRRAQVIATYLESKGIDRSRINLKSFGAENPANAAETEEAYAQNRRAEVWFE